MKVAVIGGGTAGCIMAAHLTKYFPQFELYHIYASSIPNIGVGEGATPIFQEWIHEITGLNFSDLQSRCNLTRKDAIQFENWGQINQKYMHYFHNTKVNYSYHFSAAKIGELLREYIDAISIDKKVISMESDGLAVKIGFEDTSSLEVDLAFDASGFPKSFDNNKYTNISLIPTNAALIRRGPAIHSQSLTRSIARPYGWIFSIPVTTHTSYGYIYNNSINSKNEIEEDLNVFFQQENIDYFGDSKCLNFPNFTSNIFFDGALCKIGNAACFMEPLEATALYILLAEISFFTEYILSDFSEMKKRIKLDKFKIQNFNNLLLQFIWKVAIFVGWHYASGSCFDTTFWNFATSNFKKQLNKLDKEIIDSFQKYLYAASKLDYWQYCDRTSYIKHSFAGFSIGSFYEIGHGIGSLSEISYSN